MRTTATLLVALLLTTPVVAQDVCTWTGGTGDWEAVSNWDCGGIPGSNDAAIVSSGTVTVTSDVEVDSLHLAGATTTLTGAGDITVTGGMDWPGGRAPFGASHNTLSGTGRLVIAARASLLIHDSDRRMHRVVENYGTTTWAGGRFTADSEGAGSFTNRSGATFTAAPPNDQGFYPGFANEPGATLEVRPASRAIFYGLANGGALEVDAGTMRLMRASTIEGSVAVAEGATLELYEDASYAFTSGSSVSVEGTLSARTGTATFGPGAEFTAPGRIDVATAGGSNGRIDFNTGSTKVLPDIHVRAGGTIGGSDDLVVPSGGTFRFGSGGGTVTLLGTGDVTVEAGATLVMASGSFLTERDVHNRGTATWSSGRFNDGPGALVNHGTLSLTTTGTNQFVDVRNEEGGVMTVNTPGEIGLSYFDSGRDYRFTNLGTLAVEAGTVDVLGYASLGGTVTLKEDTRLYLRSWSDGEGFATFEPGAEVSGEGLVDVGGRRAVFLGGASLTTALRSGYDFASVLDVHTALAPDSLAYGGGTLRMHLAGAEVGEYGQITAPEAVGLSGTLAVVLADGFKPEGGSVFPLIRATTVTGAFGTVHLPEGAELLVGADSVAVRFAGGVAIEPGDTFPAAFALHAPYPNPVRAAATVAFDLPEPARVRLVLYDMLGREVAVLLEGDRPAGQYAVPLEAAALPSGVYVCRIEASAFVAIRRLVRVR